MLSTQVGQQQNTSPADEPKCECPNTGRLLDQAFASWYDSETELPFVTHAPHECEGTNNLRRYRRDGKILHLCSCCNLPGDIPVEDN